MDKIKEFINALTREDKPNKPIFFNLKQETDQEKLKYLFEQKKIQHILDDYEEEQRELFGVKNPSKVYQPGFEEEFKKYYQSLSEKGSTEKHGKWVFLPWSNTLSRILDEEDFQLVRTARNRNLINQEEQDKFYNSTIGIGGLSVGSSVALALVLQGGAKHIKLADMDRLALSNTNRVLAGINNLGNLKVEMAAQRLYEINPYITIEIFPEGLTVENIESFCQDLDIIIDELDNLAIKYLIREQARKHHLPVVMAADNGDNAVVDIERYDLDPNMPYFHGRMGEVSYQELLNLDKFGIGKMITKHVGPENVTERMQESLLEMGKTIVSWPQLGGAALINGATVAYCVRKILNDQPLETNRASISLDEKLVPDYSSNEALTHRQQISESFKKIFGL